MENSYHLNIGKNSKIAFVFSCPGKTEFENEKPAFGQTGKNLEQILKNLDIDFESRYDFTITNASTSVNYKNLNNKTESTSSEILTLSNISRLNEELKDISDYIFFFGKKAKSTAIYLTNNKAKFVFSPHLSLQSLNSIKLDFFQNTPTINGSSLEKKLNIVSNLIKKQIL